MHEHNHENDPLHSFKLPKEAVTQPLQELLPNLYKHLATLPARHAATADTAAREELAEQTVSFAFPLLLHVKAGEANLAGDMATKLAPTRLDKALPTLYGACSILLGCTAGIQFTIGQPLNTLTALLNLTLAAFLMRSSGTHQATLAVKDITSRAAHKALEETIPPLGGLDLPEHNYNTAKLSDLVDMLHHLLDHITSNETDGDNHDALTAHTQHAMNLLEEIMPNIAARALND